MNSLIRPAQVERLADVEVMPIRRQHFAGFHAAVDSVARERQYLAMLEAPSFVRTRRYVLDSLKDGAVHVVALLDEKVVGWCDLRPRTAATLRHSAVLGIGVVAGHRGRGIGGRMLEATLPIAHARGIRRAELVVRADNSAAIALYRRFDFEVEGRLRQYMRIDGVDFDALLMARLDPVSPA